MKMETPEKKITNPYAKELKKEEELIKKSNPFSKTKSISKEGIKKVKTPYYIENEKSNSYFNLILDSDYQSMELDIKGLRYVSYKDDRGKEIIELERRPNHYLSEEGSEDLLMELKGHLSTDIKLGFMTSKEFLQTQEIIRKSLIKYIRKNLERLGMDTETKQRKARPLIVMILNRIRSVYSQSIQGQVNKSSHGDIKLSGALDLENDQKFKIEEKKN